MDDYRKAWAIELYDAAVIIRDVKCDASGFHEYEFPGYKINGVDVTRWAEAFGVETQPVKMYGGKYARAEDLELHLYRKVYNYGEDFSQLTQIAIYAKPLGPHLLDIRVIGHLEDGTTATYEYTYSGAYSIEWAREQHKGASIEGEVRDE